MYDGGRASGRRPVDPQTQHKRLDQLALDTKLARELAHARGGILHPCLLLRRGGRDRHGLSGRWGRGHERFVRAAWRLGRGVCLALLLLLLLLIARVELLLVCIRLRLAARRRRRRRVKLRETAQLLLSERCQEKKI